MPDWVVSMGVNALMEVTRSSQGRKKWARALAKVFVAIKQAQELDSNLAAAIKAKESD